MVELETILQSLITQVPVIGVLVWVVAKQGREIETWKQQYFTLEQRLHDVLRDNQKVTQEELRTLTAIERRRSEYDLREFKRLFGLEDPKSGNYNPMPLQNVDLQTMRDDE